MTDDVYAFATEPDTDRVLESDIDTINDTALFNSTREEYGEQIGSDVTEHPDGNTQPIHTDMPSRFYTGRVPRTPLIGRCVTRTVNVFGDGVIRPLVSKNINRYRLQVFADSGNTGGIAVIGSNGDGIVVGAGSVPVEFRSFEAFSVKATANGILYLIDESYYVNESGV